MLLVDLVRPQLVVELGTQHGDSYCAFCQAVKELGLTTRCYAIDTWQGDPHTGFYGPEVLAELRRHHDPLYGNFSTLIRSTFAEAIKYFGDASIDILHVDGYHTYDVVRHDFESWIPKVSKSGLILLHDTNVRERDFGVWKLWRELCAHHPHFEFLHGHGLGVLAASDQFPSALRDLFDASPEETSSVRRAFSALGARLSLQAGLHQREAELAAVREELGRDRATLAQREAELAAVREELGRDRATLAQREAELAAVRDELGRDRATLAQREAEVGAARDELGRDRATLAQREAALAATRDELARTRASTAWRLLTFCRRMVKPLL